MKRTLFFFLIHVYIMPYYAQKDFVKLSQEFLKNCKMNESFEANVIQLKQQEFEKVKDELNTDKKKLAFWINIYNATTQSSLKQHPEYFKDRANFYKRKLIMIGGQEFSLDEIEHGILRRNTSKYSLGYFRKLSTRKEIKKLMVKRIDPRIHYALNCGAKSCPPVLFFDDVKIDEQLDLSCRAYLEAECEIKDGKIYVPALFSWFRGDFGGKKGIYKFLWKYEILKKREKPNLVFKEYNWDLSIGNYI